MKTDEEIVSEIRQDLQYGSVSSAKERLNDIRDFMLRQEIKRVIQDYEGHNDDYY